MAKIHGIAGEWARVRGMVAGLWPLFLAVFVSGFAFALMIVSAAIGLAALILALIFMVWSLHKGLRHVERFFKGARGEEKVAEILKSLPDDFHIFNDFTIGNYHIDHVVVGPCGVFAVETKFWNGQITIEDKYVLIDGKLPTRSPIEQVNREAILVKRALKDLGWEGTITPIVAFASNTFAAKQAFLGGTLIINSDMLKECFIAGRKIIASDELQRLISLMETRG